LFKNHAKKAIFRPFSGIIKKTRYLCPKPGYLVKNSALERQKSASVIDILAGQNPSMINF
jgi:hypothetical protein